MTEVKLKILEVEKNKSEGQKTAGLPKISQFGIHHPYLLIILDSIVSKDDK